MNFGNFRPHLPFPHLLGGNYIFVLTGVLLVKKSARNRELLIQTSRAQVKSMRGEMSENQVLLVFGVENHVRPC